MEREWAAEWNAYDMAAAYAQDVAADASLPEEAWKAHQAIRSRIVASIKARRDAVPIFGQATQEAHDAGRGGA